MKKYIYGSVAIVILTMAFFIQHKQNKYDQLITQQTQERIERNKEIITIQEENRAKEAQLQDEFEQERMKWYEEKLAMENNISNLRNVSDSLRATIEAGKRGYLTDEKPDTTTRVNESNQACWVVLDESIREYEAMAREADQLNSRLIIGQKWARVISNHD